MNWLLLVNSSLAFGLLFVVLLTLTFFINYKRDRKAAVKKSAHPYRGRYFVRHVPDALKSQYSPSEENKKAHENTRWEIKKFRAISYIPAGVFMSALAFFMFQFGHLVRGPSALSEKEIEALKYTEFSWKVQPEPSAPKWLEIQKSLKGRNLVLLSNPTDVEWTHPSSGRAWVKSTLADWRAWAGTNGVAVKECEWSHLAKCGQASRDIFLVPPGRWDADRLDQLMKQGASVLLLGAPTSIFADQRGFTWNDLSFERTTEAQAGPLVLAGDQILTLGLPAGKILPLPTTEPGYRVLSESADAYRISAQGLFPEQVETALVGKTVGRGRFVWADFTPVSRLAAKDADEAVELINASIFRFLVRKPYESVATWPEGKSSAAFLSVEVEENVGELKSLFKTKGLSSLGWYLMTNPVEQQGAPFEAMAKLGELNCHGDSHDRFDSQSLRKQTQRLALCRKVVTANQRNPVLGFRPPEEKFNSDTVSAAVNAGFDYMFVGRSGAQASPQVYATVGTPGPTLLVISRMVADDQFLFGEGGLGEFDRKKIAENDWRWMQRIRGLHTYNFRTQNLKIEGHKELIGQIAEQSHAADSFTTSPGEIVSWWRLRNQILGKHKVDASAIEKFRPVKLSVNANGQMVRTPMYVDRGTASQGK